MVNPLKAKHSIYLPEKRILENEKKAFQIVLLCI